MLKLLIIEHMIDNGRLLGRWLKQHDAKRIMIVSDQIAKDPDACLRLSLSLPKGTKSTIKTVRHAQRMLRDGLFETEDWFAAAENSDDGERLKSVCSIGEVYRLIQSDIKKMD